MFLKKIVIIFAVKIWMALFVPLQNGFVFAEEKRPFDSLAIGLQYTANINRNLFHDFYELGKGVEGFVEMPFYHGDIQFAIQVLSYSAREKGKIQDFKGVFTHLKWGKGYTLSYGVRWFSGIGVGLYAFLPGDLTLSDPYKVAHFTETELSAGLNSHLRYPISQNWMMRFEVSYNRIFTYKPIDLAYFSTGIGYTFATPKWLKGFLE